MKKERLKMAIDEVKKDLESFEIDPDKHEESFIEMLDDSGPVDVCGLKFNPSRIWQELDPIAFRCGLTDYVDSLDVTDDEDYKALEDKLSDLESELEPINSLHEEWEACDKIKIFEFAVIDTRTGEKEWVTFDITLEDGQFIARHEALNAAQEASDIIASVKIDIDYDFSLDENLQALHEDCLESVGRSDYFELTEE